jgi:hypothetical protein
MRSSSWLVSRPMRRDSDIGSPSQMLMSIDDRGGDRGRDRRNRGNRGFWLANRASPRVHSYGEADRGGSSGEGGGWPHDETERPGDEGALGKGLKEEDGCRGGQRAVFIDVESGGRPVRAPRPIRRPLNPGGPTPRPRL